MWRRLFGLGPRNRNERGDRRRRRRRTRPPPDDDEEWKKLDPYSTEGVTAHLKRHFGGRHGDLKFKRIIAQGAFGVTSLLHDVRQYPPKRFIVKRALEVDDTDDLRKEIKYLKPFRGAAHIIQITGYRDRGANETSADGTLPGPYIIADYLENGTFEAFMDRVTRARVRVPNRVLWSVMLCFVRACVALTWPTRGRENTRERLEVTSQVRAPTVAYAHNDLHMENVMFGALQPNIAEHSLFLPCKLIDFGMAESRELFPILGSNVPNIFQGPPSNTESLARVMMRLITGQTGRLPDRPAIMTGGIETDATLLWERGAERRYPWLDQRLRELIGIMMSRDYRDRPFLEGILAGAFEIERTIRSRDFPEEIQREESTRAVRAFVQRFFLDA